MAALGPYLADGADAWVVRTRRTHEEGVMAGKQKPNVPPALKEPAVKTTGEYKGKSNALGHGGRAQQLRDKGVPEGVIGELARKAGAAPGGPNYHGKRGKK